MVTIILDGVKQGGGGSGSSTFTGLSDTPASFVGQAGLVASVNDAETALEFTAGGSGLVDSVNSQTGDVVLDADDISDTSTTNKFVTATDITNLGNLSGSNSGDQTSGDFDHNSLTNTHNLTSNIDHTSISNIGSNSHSDIDTHISSTSNPHSTTILNLGDVTITDPLDYQALVYVDGSWVNQPASVYGGAIYG